MNEMPPPSSEDLLGFQTARLEELITETVRCCEDRKLFESQKFGLPYAALKCLRLFNGQRYLTVKTIARQLDVAKSRVTKIVAGLGEKGLVNQTADPRDGRVRLIALTAAGGEKLQQIRSFEREIHRRLLLEMREQERKSVLFYLEMLRSAMESVKARLGEA